MLLTLDEQAAKQFDIISATPTTEKLFAQCCEKLEVGLGLPRRTLLVNELFTLRASFTIVFGLDCKVKTRFMARGS